VAVDAHPEVEKFCISITRQFVGIVDGAAAVLIGSPKPGGHGAKAGGKIRPSPILARNRR